LLQNLNCYILFLHSEDMYLGGNISEIDTFNASLFSLIPLVKYFANASRKYLIRAYNIISIISVLFK